MEASPALPTKFPCWVRAVYSWGGESKKDLGFVEGDLIECLNAGDGQWWMGRLRRDKRAMGLFPSNFVKVLGEGFTPVNRMTSPMPDLSQNNTPPKGKSKTVRKPYQSYAAPAAAIKKPNENRPSAAPSPIPMRQNSYLQNPTETPSRQNSYNRYGQDVPSRQNSYLQHHNQDVPSRQNSYLQYHSQDPSRQNSSLGSRAPSPGLPMHLYSSRAPSPVPPMQHYSRAPSPAPPPAPPMHHYSRAPSPAPSMYHHSRAPSPDQFDDLGSSPPPPAPPPHRIAYQPQRTPSPDPSMTGEYPPLSRAQSPAINTPATHGHTPSPLRDAMDDVMSSLQDMGMREDAPSPLPASLRAPSPLNPWSPEAFQELNTGGRRGNHRRAQTSMGLGIDKEPGYNEWEGGDSDHQHNEGYHHRMQQKLQNMHNEPQYVSGNPIQHDMGPPPTPARSRAYSRPGSAMGDSSYQAYRPNSSMDLHQPMAEPQNKLRNRKSAYELGRNVLGRTFTAKSTVTNASNGTQSTSSHSTSTQLTNQSIMSGQSAGGFSATSAGSLARRKAFGSFRRKARPQSVADMRTDDMMGANGSSNLRPKTPSDFSGPSYHSSHASGRPISEIPPEWAGSVVESGNPMGGLAQLKPKRSGFFKKFGEAFKTGTASARSSIAGGGQEVSRNPVKSMLPKGVTGISSGNPATDMGLGGGKGGIDWVQVRRDVNRSNSLSKNERQERSERCQMLGQPVVDSVDIFEDTAEGDEDIDGMVVSEPTNFHAINLQLVDKSSRFVTNLPPMTNPISLAQGYVCRPYRSDVQRFRSIFTWVSEKIAWEEDFEGAVDTRRVIQTLRGCAQEVAVLVMEMCQAVGLHAEVVRGYLKPPDELPTLDTMPRPNHWWNAVLVDCEWRFMDCSLASPTNPKRSLYSSSPSVAAEPFYFLTRPMESIYTHIPSNLDQQHIVPPVDPSVLLALPCALPPYFRNSLHVENYSTALIYLQGLELLHLSLSVPSDVELHAEVHARAYARDSDGDLYDSGDTITKRALAQAEWKNSQKRYIVKALLPPDASEGTLHLYAGKRGLMHGIKDNPHPLALSLPVFHEGENPAFDFLARHPTPHAQRHDLYLAQPQCRTLVCNNTFVFSVRQHPSSLTCSSPPLPGRPPSALNRPASSLSMNSSQASSSQPSSTSYFTPGAGGQGQGQKPAKLAVQAPSGKILRLSRKIEGGLVEEGGTWETIIKVGERGTWRGLVLADRSARWCVWGEWECV
ncbi:MAG: cytokinesis protein 3 [Stictis urceolatum]|nr:cytokinesis protein 3 [Stictis urceolata]